MIYQWFKMKYFKPILLLIPLLTTACEKDDSVIFDNSGSPLLKQIYRDSVLLWEYAYNDADLIIEEKSKLYYTRHHYDHRNLITSSDYYYDKNLFSSYAPLADSAFNRKEWVNPENTGKSSSRTYTYNDRNQLIRSSINSGYTEYTYNADGRISCETFFYEQKKSGFIEYQYDGKGNMIRRSHYWVLTSGESELATTTEYKFDNHPNPYWVFRCLMIPGINTNINNITEETYTLFIEVDQTIDKVQITRNYYEYNDIGFPVKKNGNVEYRYYQ